MKTLKNFAFFLDLFLWTIGGMAIVLVESIPGWALIPYIGVFGFWLVGVIMIRARKF